MLELPRTRSHIIGSIDAASAAAMRGDMSFTTDCRSVHPEFAALVREVRNAGDGLDSAPSELRSDTAEI